VEAAWKLVGGILQITESPDSPPPRPYEAGSWGPRDADALLARDGRAWRRP
jgi:glucose-6-phosphate 1-dehydrogenase